MGFVGIEDGEGLLVVESRSSITRTVRNPMPMIMTMSRALGEVQTIAAVCQSTKVFARQCRITCMIGPSGAQ
jgi:hypothetical protein